MKWYFIELHDYVMNIKAEHWHLAQIFPLLQLAPVTFRPTLSYHQVTGEKAIDDQNFQILSFWPPQQQKCFDKL